MSAEDPSKEGSEGEVGTEGGAKPADADEVKHPRTEVTLRYAGASQVSSEGGKTTVSLFGNTQRGEVRGGGKVRDPLRLREALSALHDVVSSDFRYIPKDRTQYMAYMRLRKQAAGMNLWEAQRAYVDWLQRNDPLAFALLDPIVTVHPDQLFLEVFSKDEGSYAKLGIDWSALRPGTRLDFADGGPLVETTMWAAPCKTIAESFTERDVRRIDAVRQPGSARLYAKVLRDGVVRPGQEFTLS